MGEVVLFILMYRGRVSRIISYGCNVGGSTILSGIVHNHTVGDDHGDVPNSYGRVYLPETFLVFCGLLHFDVLID